MTKKFFRGLILGVIVFAAAVTSGYLSYVITCRYRNVGANCSAVKAATAETDSEDEICDTADIDNTEYYIAKLENNNISIYTCHGKTEEFLYSFDVQIRNLTAEDVKQLQTGIVLEDKQKLAAFKEDFS